MKRPAVTPPAIPTHTYKITNAKRKLYLLHITNVKRKQYSDNHRIDR